MTVTGLVPGASYYVVVETVTDPHEYNSNTVVSEPTAEVSARTLNPRLSVDDVSVEEQDSGETIITFTVTLEGAAEE
jgi:hypothetical protein